MNTERRVVYIGTGRGMRKNSLGRIGLYESEGDWRKRLASEMEDACREMARRGLRLTQVVPILSTATWKGSWTEGAWLFFAGPDSGATPSDA